MKEIIEAIKKLKKEKNAVILAHCYQNIEIDEVADFVGDSLKLSIESSKTNAGIIVFAGVKFMAETAKILSPNKKVLLPEMYAGCDMADMINEKQLDDFKAKYPDTPVVCYVNSTAAVKAKSDICCTSANAVSVVNSLNSNKVLFVPDKNLGRYVNSKLPNKEIITYDGFCPVHNNITKDDVIKMKNKYPNAKILIHPECTKDVLDFADFIGSTTAIMKYVKENDYNEYIIVTEKGVTDRLSRDYKNKKFYLITPKTICNSMKLTTLESILETLQNEKNEITLDEELREKAYSSIKKMIDIV